MVYFEEVNWLFFLETYKLLEYIPEYKKYSVQLGCLETF